jgi:hypothetical protein
MLTHENWVTSNILERVNNPNVDFKVNLKLTKCHHLSFHAAANYTAKLIPYEKKYVAFSGGADSEYVVRTFVRNNITFTPVIILIRGTNNFEILNALNVCKELNLTPVVLEFTEEQIFKVYISEIFKKLNGNGLWATPQLLVAKYAAQNQGVAVNGDYLVDTTDHPHVIWSCEVDGYYQDYLVPNVTVPFFHYTREIVRAMSNSNLVFENKDFTNTCNKCTMYGLKDRPKQKNKLSNPLNIKIFRALLDTIVPQSDCIIMTKKEFIERC